jgi:hypothetical protein
MAATERAFDAMKTLEEMRQLVVCDTGAGVGDSEHNTSAVARETDGNLALKCKLERIRD